MRVGILTYGLDRAPTGIGRYTVALVRALAALPSAPNIVLLTTEREDRHGLWHQFERHALPNCTRLPMLLTAGNALVATAARRARLDVVHDPNGIAPFLAPLGAARRIVTIHDAFAYACPAAHNRLDTWRYRVLLPHSARRADMVLTDSQHSRQDLIRYLNIPADQIRTIGCGIDPYFAPVAAGAARRAVLERYGVRSPYLLYVGGINARKNVARLLEAFARVRTQHPDLRLVIGGKRQWRTGEIDATLARLDLGDAVQWTGYLADADLPALYSAAQAFVFPSLYEGFGLPPLEAMACGTPVITSNVSSLPEVVGDAAVLIDPYDVGALARAIEQVLTDAASRVTLRERGLQQAALWTWDRTARNTLAAYHNVLRLPDTTLSPPTEGVPVDAR